MNKEEIKCITKEQLNQLEWSDTHEYGTTLAYELIERIDKAKEWINNHIDTFEERNITIYDWNSLSNPKELLDILKEV